MPPKFSKTVKQRQLKNSTLVLKKSRCHSRDSGGRKGNGLKAVVTCHNNISCAFYQLAEQALRFYSQTNDKRHLAVYRALAGADRARSNV